MVFHFLNYYIAICNTRVRAFYRRLCYIFVLFFFVVFFFSCGISLWIEFWNFVHRTHICRWRQRPCYAIATNDTQKNHILSSSIYLNFNFVSCTQCQQPAHIFHSVSIVRYIWMLNACTGKMLKWRTRARSPLILFIYNNNNISNEQRQSQWKKKLQQKINIWLHIGCIRIIDTLRRIKRQTTITERETNKIAEMLHCCTVVLCTRLHK